MYRYVGHVVSATKKPASDQVLSRKRLDRDEVHLSVR